MYRFKHKFRSRSRRPALDIESIERDLLAELERGGPNGENLVDRLLRAIEGAPAPSRRRHLR